MPRSHCRQRRFLFSKCWKLCVCVCVCATDSQVVAHVLWPTSSHCVPTDTPRSSAATPPPCPSRRTSRHLLLHHDRLAELSVWNDQLLASPWEHYHRCDWRYTTVRWYGLGSEVRLVTVTLRWHCLGSEIALVNSCTLPVLSIHCGDCGHRCGILGWNWGNLNFYVCQRCFLCLHETDCVIVVAVGQLVSLFLTCFVAERCVRHAVWGRVK